jgi:hypothetical protein
MEMKIGDKVKILEDLLPDHMGNLIARGEIIYRQGLFWRGVMWGVRILKINWRLRNELYNN